MPEIKVKQGGSVAIHLPGAANPALKGVLESLPQGRGPLARGLLSVSRTASVAVESGWDGTPAGLQRPPDQAFFDIGAIAGLLDTFDITTLDEFTMALSVYKHSFPEANQ